MTDQKSNILSLTSKTKKEYIKCTVIWDGDKNPLEIEVSKKGLEILDHPSNLLMIQDIDGSKYYISPFKVLYIIEEEIEND